MLFASYLYISLNRLFFTVLLCLLFAVSVEAGDPFGFIGNWDYRKSGGDEGGTSQLNETYNLTYSKELSAAMAFSGSVRYSENQPSEGDDSRSLNPSLSFDINNDLFFLNLNASRTENERDGKPTRTADTWGFNLSSQLEEWPSMRFYFNQGKLTDDDSPKTLNSDSTSVGASIEHSFQHVDLLYDVRHSKSNDKIDRIESTTFDQTGQIGYDQVFWRGRVSVSASQLYQITDSKTDTTVGTGNTFFLDVQALGGFYYIDNTPATGPPIGTLPDKADLVDDDLNTSTGIDIFSTTSQQNMGVSFSGLKPTVSRLRVVMVDDQLTSTASSQQGSVNWAVFSSDLGDVWSPVPLAPSQYIEENGHSIVVLDLVSSVNERYLKVVSSAALALIPIFVSELEAEEAVVATADKVSVSFDSENLQTQLTLTVRPTVRWLLSYNLRRAETRQDSGDTLQVNNSLNSSYFVSERLSFSAGVSENIDNSDNVADLKNRSYSLSMSALPLPTLNISLGYTHSETDSDDSQDTVSDSISSAFNAIIYPDLTASLTTNWTQTEDRDDGSKRRSYGIALNTTAYFTPKVDMTSNISYVDSESSNSTGYAFTLGYRPSDILLLNFGYDGEVEQGTSTFSANSNWLWSKKLQSQFGLVFDFGDEDSQQYNTVLSWLINRSLSLQASGNYLATDEADLWTTNVSVNMIF